MPASIKSLLAVGRKERGSGTNSSRVLSVIGAFLVWWILIAFVYGGTQSNFLRAESGWFLFLSHSTPEVRHQAEINLLTKSFNGHYTPISFLAEFELAKLVGPHARFWKWRQITAVALLATMLFLLTRNSGYVLQLSRPNASLSAAGLTAILIFQGQMRTFVANPFLIRQLFWLIFSLIALLALVQMVRRPGENSWPWIAAGASCASLECFGLGIATVTATAAVLAGIWLIPRRNGSSSDAAKIIIALISMIALTALHVVFMLKFSFDPPIASSPGWSPQAFLTMSLGFIPNFVFAMLRGIFSTWWLAPTSEQIPADWPYGVGILLGFGCLITSVTLRSLKKPTPRNQVRFILHTFSSGFFLAVVALTLARAWREPSTFNFVDYLKGARYLVPGGFVLSGLMIELIFLLAPKRLVLSAFLSIGLAVCAIAGQLQYARDVYPKVEPNSMISHGQAWRAIVAMARECRRANLPIPNAPLGVLTQEFSPWDLKLFEPLLCADLNCPPGTKLQFVEWPDSMNNAPNEYERIPSFVKLRAILRNEINQ